MELYSAAWQQWVYPLICLHLSQSRYVSFFCILIWVKKAVLYISFTCELWKIVMPDSLQRGHGGNHV